MSSLTSLPQWMLEQEEVPPFFEEESEPETLEDLLATIGAPVESILGWWNTTIGNDFVRGTDKIEDLLICCRSVDDEPTYDGWCRLWGVEPLTAEAGELFGLYHTLRYHLTQSLGVHYVRAVQLAVDGR